MSHLLKKSLMENFIFCAVREESHQYQYKNVCEVADFILSCTYSV